MTTITGVIPAKAGIREIISRLGLADVRVFGITWEDCEKFLNRLGYQSKVTVQEKLVYASLAVKTGIPDLATEHDHYLYGTPKRRA